MSYQLRIRRRLERLLKGMKFGPYKAEVVQRLVPRNEVARMEFCNRMLGILNEDPDVLNNVLTRDEAHLQVSYFVNKQNVRYRAPVNSREMHERLLHSPKVTEHSRLWVSFLVILAKMLQLMLWVTKLPTAVASTW